MAADYDQAVALMSQHWGMQDFVGPRPEPLVKAAEDRLGVRFPPSYRRFLIEHGAGSFGSSEVYGVIGTSFDQSSVPDGIWYTLSERKESNLPSTMVVIFNDGSGDLFCIDSAASRPDGEAPVVRFQPGIPVPTQRPEVIARDFGSFLLDVVRREISRTTRT